MVFFKLRFMVNHKKLTVNIENKMMNIKIKIYVTVVYGCYNVEVVESCLYVAKRFMSKIISGRADNKNKILNSWRRQVLGIWGTFEGQTRIFGGGGKIEFHEISHPLVCQNFWLPGFFSIHFFRNFFPDISNFFPDL